MPVKRRTGYAQGMTFDPGELVSIPGGEITLRDARTGSTQMVNLLPFQLARVPVTVPAAGVQHERPRAVPHTPVTWFDAVRWCNRESAAAGLRPAYRVAGREVQWDVSADGYRLPTEAEWEWACRAGTTGPTYGPLHAIAWTAADAVNGPSPVGGKAANSFGLFDTIGNVWEWCWNYADTARYGDYRALRGGGWADPAWSNRASVRRGSAPDAVIDDVGFRVARGAVGAVGDIHAQGWSANADAERARITGPLPVGWTPLARPTPLRSR